MQEEAHGAVDESLLERRVVPYWDHIMGRKWMEMGQQIPMRSLLEMASVRVGSDSREKDRMGWLLASGGEFIVNSAYKLACGWTEDDVWDGWRRMWKLKTTQRVKVFGWIMSHGCLLTNLERWKRRMTGCADYSRCSQMTKDVLHAVRDCRWVREVWHYLIPPEFYTVFFSLDLEDWVLSVLRRGKIPRGDRRWPEKIMAACWW